LIISEIRNHTSEINPLASVMQKRELQERLKQYAISIVKFSEELPDKSGFNTVKNQIVRSAPSAAANYRAACRAKSDADYISKMGTVEEELDETMFWLEFTVGLSEEFRSMVKPLWKEGDELLAIIVSSIITKKRNKIKKQ
jgi:four helix bundle protein